MITRVAVEHLEFFADVDEIALAERELIENLPGRNTVSVLNADDERVMKMAAVAPGRVVTFGVGGAANFRAEEIEDRGAEGSAFTFVAPEGTCAVGAVAGWTAQRDECAGCVGGGERLGNWRARSC